MTEKRLISLDEALDATHNEMFWTESEAAAVRSFLVKRPRVDAVEVVHGQWLGEGDGYADGRLVYDVWFCSECNFCIDSGIDDPELLPKYCENCGAKMDKEGINAN